MNNNQKILSKTYFETIRCEDEKISHLKYHQQRISRTIGLNINLEEYIYPPNNQLLKCKVIYDKNGILDVNFTKYTPKDISSFKIIEDNEINYQFKSTSREAIETLYNKKENCDEIIIVKNGLVTDTSIANIAIYENDIWLTPKKPLLLGTTRERLLELNQIKLHNITIEQLLNCNKIALLNAMIGIKIIEDYKILL